MELYENSSSGMSLALGCIFAFYATLFMWRAGTVIFFVVFVALGFGVLMGALPRGMIIYYFDHYG